jgi:hypothetical protein
VFAFCWNKGGLCEVSKIQSSQVGRNDAVDAQIKKRKNDHTSLLTEIYLQESSLGQPRAPQLPPKCQLQRAEMASGWMNRSLRMKRKFDLRSGSREA